MAPSYKMFPTELNFSLEIQLNIKTQNNHYFLWSPFSKHAILHPLFRMRQIHYFLIVNSNFDALDTSFLEQHTDSVYILQFAYNEL